MTGQGPLRGIKVVEFSGIGPAPMCGMLLADLGAEVITIERHPPSRGGIQRPPAYDICRRNRRTLALDLKHQAGLDCALRLIEQADALIEGFRPGAMERLGLGPEACAGRNPKLVYGRVTGWGQTGPLSQTTGHDLNYIALSGALAAIGRAGEPPTIPLNLVGDYGGGGLLLAFGVVCAILEARTSGKGQVVDAAMVEGASTLMASLHGLVAAGIHGPDRGCNLLDGGAPHYNVYACADGKWITIAPLEPQFRRVLFDRLGIDAATFPDLDDRASWPEANERLAAIFASRTRNEWGTLLEGSDACFAPVLDIGEAVAHPHNVARQSFVDIAGVVQPAPAPKFSRTPSALPTPPENPGQSTHTVLAAWDFSAARIAELARLGVIPPTS